MRARIPIGRIAVLLLLAPVVPAQEREAKHLLRLAFREGATSRHVSSHTMTVKRVGVDVEYRIKMAFTVETRVAEVHGTHAVLIAEITRVRASGETEPRFEYDSDVDDSAPPYARQISQTLGTRLRYRRDLRGRVGWVDVPAVIEKLDADAQSEFLRFRELIVGDALELPEEPVAVGAKWTTASRRKGRADRAIDVHAHNQLVSVDGPRVTIARRITRRHAAAELPDTEAPPPDRADDAREAGARTPPPDYTVRGRVAIDMTGGLPMRSWTSDVVVRKTPGDTTSAMKLRIVSTEKPAAR